jgi:hypothetical protein
MKVDDAESNPESFCSRRMSLQISKLLQLFSILQRLIRIFILISQRITFKEAPSNND